MITGRPIDLLLNSFNKISDTILLVNQTDLNFLTPNR